MDFSNNKYLRRAKLIAAVHDQCFPGAYAFNTPEQLELWEDTASDTDDGGLSDHFPSEGSKYFLLKQFFTIVFDRFLMTYILIQKFKIESLDHF